MTVQNAPSPARWQAVYKLSAEQFREIAEIRRQLAEDYNAPAQRIINAGFARMGVNRFQGPDDLWEMLEAWESGEEYQRPPRELLERWARS